MCGDGGNHFTAGSWSQSKCYIFSHINVCARACVAGLWAAAGTVQLGSGSFTLRAGRAFCWTCRPNYPGMCLCTAVKAGLPISAFVLGINLVSWDHPGGDDVSLHFQIINHLHWTLQCVMNSSHEKCRVLKCFTRAFMYLKYNDLLHNIEKLHR